MDPDRLARLELSRLCEPGSWAVHAAVRSHGALAVRDALRAGRVLPPIGAGLTEGARQRAESSDLRADLARLDRIGARFVVPGDPEWPTERLSWHDGLEHAPPLGLFLLGSGDLRQLSEHAVSVVGARASTAYGVHVAGELGLQLADRGWTVLSGAAYGIDGAAHRGALASERGVTVAVLACAVDVCYPKGHTGLLAAIASRGLVVSEHPPGCAPTRSRFLVRNRLIAALSVGTVVVEAAVRSGSLTTARQAGSLNRHLMAVPGPVTSELSRGCHRLLREGAICVTGAPDVLDLVGALGPDAAVEARAAGHPRDELSATVRRVLDAVPVRRWAGPASIARAAGVPTLTVQQVLPPLQLAGLVEESLDGWRLTTLGAGRPARAAS